MISDIPDNRQSDIDLMLSASGGDIDAFDALCGRYRRRIEGFFYSLCWNSDAAQDYAQEVFVRLWLHRGIYKPTASFSAYIYRIAKNLWVSAIRSGKCRPNTIPLYDFCIEDDSSNLEKLMMSRYRDRRIRMAVDALPDHYRFVFIMCHYQDMRYQEIAEALEIPVGTVKSRMSAATRMLRETISIEMRDE